MPRSPESRARRAAYAREWRRRHPDYHRRHADEHRERVRAQTRARQCRYRERNPGLWRRYRDRDRALPAIQPPHWEEELRWARLLVDRVCLRDLTVPYAALDDDYHDLVA